MDITAEIKAKTEQVVAQLKKDPALLSRFQAEPIKTLETLTGIDLPDEQLQPLVTAVKAKLAAGDVAELAGKLGGVFATAHYAQGGADVAIMTLLPHMLVKGMLVYSGGAAHGKPYIHLGPVALDAVGNHYEECKADFEIFGRRFAEKARELFPNK